MQTPHPGIMLARDGIRCDSPVALMERAGTAGFLPPTSFHPLWSGWP
jgi:carotenoid phi-ring synthase / carotenoid chi-ring synthase